MDWDPMAFITFFCQHLGEYRFAFSKHRNIQIQAELCQSPCLGDLPKKTVDLLKRWFSFHGSIPGPVEVDILSMRRLGRTHRCFEPFLARSLFSIKFDVWLCLC